MSLLKTNEIQNYNGSSLTLTASTVSTSAQLNTGGNISVTGSLNVSDDSTTRTNLGLGTIATQDSDSITVTGGTATLGALTVSGSDSGNLVRITQTGSGNALVVEDSANPDSSPFVVNASGDVLVGTTTSQGKLTSVPKSGFFPSSTAGTWATSAAISVSGSFGGGVSWIDGSAGYSAWVDDNGNDFNIAGGGTGAVAAGGVYLNNYAGSWSSRSDERDKINLEPITDAATKIKSLRAVIGEYVWAEGVRHPFLIAQDVQQVLPEAVSIANKSAPEEEQRLGISYTDIIPLLTAALQESIALIESQQSVIDALTARIVDLETT